jgi:transposase
MHITGLSRFVDLPGWVTESAIFERKVLAFAMHRDGRLSLLCPKCGEKMSLNRKSHHRIKDLGMGPELRMELCYEAPQGRCRTCRLYHTFHPPGVDAASGTTQRYRGFVSSLCRKMTLSDTAEVMGIAPSTTYRIDFRFLSETVRPPSFDGLDAILVDENAVRCGELFVTFVINARTGELLYQGSGKRSDTLRAFFDLLTPEQKSSIKAVCIDRSGAFRDAITSSLPHAAIVYDKFHLIANYHAVLDEVRRKAWHDAEEKEKAFIKGQRYNLFRNVENLSAEMLLTLDALLKSNADISVAYILRDQFKSIWSYGTPESMKTALDQWLALAKDSGVESVMRFAKNLGKATKEIIAYAVHRITNGPMEGFNNLVSRLIHRANGIRSLSYLFLRLRAETTPRRVCGGG